MPRLRTAPAERVCTGVEEDGSVDTVVEGGGVGRGGGDESERKAREVGWVTPEKERDRRKFPFRGYGHGEVLVKHDGFSG